MIITHDNFYMPQLDRTRTIRVLLPKNYDNQKSFPVLYMQDGQNLFDPETSFSGDWKIPHTMETLVAKKQAIIVGIDNGGDVRMNEYAPFSHGKDGGGEGDKYVRFIIETLKPFIDSEYRTMPDRDTTGIAGSSLGGLIAFYAGVKYGSVFGKVGVLSPALWFNPKVLDLVNPSLEFKSKFYVLASKTESRMMEKTLENVYWAFKNGGFSDENFRVTVRDRGKHNEIFWAREFKKMYEFIFC